MAPRTNLKPSRPIQHHKLHTGFVQKATPPKEFFKPFDRIWTTRRLDTIMYPRSEMAAGGGYDHVAPGFPIRPSSASWIGLRMPSGYIASHHSSIFAAQASSMHDTYDVEYFDVEPSMTNSYNNQWTAIRPAIPIRHPALTGRVALEILLEIRNGLYSNMGVQHCVYINDVYMNDLANRYGNTDLLNGAAVRWLASIMEPTPWSAIQVDLIEHRASIAELEDEITALLRREQQSQTPCPFDISCASRTVRHVFEAYVKALVEKQVEHDREQRTIDMFRKLNELKWPKFMRNSPANDPKRMTPREMKPASERVIESCESDETGEVPDEDVEVKREPITL